MDSKDFFFVFFCFLDLWGELLCESGISLLLINFRLWDGGSINLVLILIGFLLNSDSGSDTEKICPVINPWCINVLCSNFSNRWISTNKSWGTGLFKSSIWTVWMRHNPAYDFAHEAAT